MNRRETRPPARTEHAITPPVVYEFRSFRLDPRRRLLTSATGEPISITAKGYETLLLLVQRAGELVSREELIRAVWPTTVVEENNLNQAIATLRRALGEGYIVTVAGKGYQFVAPVTNGAAAEVPDGPSPLPSLSPRRTPLLAALALLAAIGVGTILYLSIPAMTSATDAPLGPVTQVTPLTSFPGDENAPSFSPDGTRIAFSWARDNGEADLYVTQPGAGDPLRLTRGGTNRDPAWSPQGTQIAFLRQRDPERLDLMLVPALGGAERVLRSITMYFVSREGSPRLAWTADGRQLIFTTQRDGPSAGRAFELRAIDIDTGRMRPLHIAQLDTDFDTSPALTADGKQLAFVRFLNSQRLGRLMVQDLGPDLQPLGEPRRIPGPEPTSTPHSLSWTRDGRFLRFIVGANLTEWDVHANSVRTVHTMSSPIGAMTMVATASGTRAAAMVLNRDEDLWAVPLDPLTHVARGPAVTRAKSTSFERHPQFSPDGQHLAFISGRSGKAALWVADADGAHPHQLTWLNEYVTGFPRWSPDGTRIAFHTSSPNRDRMVYTVEARGGMPAKLGPGCCPTGWSADGKYLYVGDLGRINRAARMRVSDGQRETLFEGDFTVETAGGGKLLYARTAEPGIFTRSASGDLAHNPEEKLVDDYRLTLGGFVAAKNGFYYLGHTPAGQPQAFRYYDYATREVRDVAPAPRGVSLGLAVSPDESELLYSADATGAGADLVLLEFASKK